MGTPGAPPQPVAEFPRAQCGPHPRPVAGCPPIRRAVPCVVVPPGSLRSIPTFAAASPIRAPKLSHHTSGTDTECRRSALGPSGRSHNERRRNATGRVRPRPWTPDYPYYLIIKNKRVSGRQPAGNFSTHRRAGQAFRQFLRPRRSGWTTCQKCHILDTLLARLCFFENSLRDFRIPNLNPQSPER